MHSACVTLCLCVRALSCMSCAKRARRLKIVLRSGNICTNVIAGSGRSVAKRGATLAMHLDQALSISSAAWRPRLASQEGVVVKGYFSRSHVMQYAPKNRVAALLPRTVRPAPGASKRGRAPPPPPAWPARNLLFDTQRRRRKKMRLSDAFVKRVFQEQAPPLRCAAGCPIARFATQAYALIVLLSTHGRELLAQTAKTKVPSWNRQNYFIAPHSTRARLTRGGELGRNSVLKLHGGRPRQKKQP